MATLASGTSITITLVIGQSLVVEAGGAGQAVLGPGAQANQAINLGLSRTTVGPFPAQQLVNVTSTNGTLVYKLAAVGNGVDKLNVASTGAEVPGIVNSQDYGLRFDGSDSYTKVQQWVNAAVTYAQSESTRLGRAIKSPLYVPNGAVFDLDQQLQLNCTYTRLIGNDALFLVSNDASGGINIFGTGFESGPQFAKYYQFDAAVENLRIVYNGASAAAAVAGIQMTGQPASQQQTPANSYIRNVSIDKCFDGVRFTNFTAINTLQNMNIRSCNNGVRADSTSYGFERMLMDSVHIYNGGVGLNISEMAGAAGGDWYWGNSSCDYNAVNVKGKYNNTLYADRIHFESGTQSNPMFQWTGGHAGDGIYASHCQFLVAGSPTFPHYAQMQENARFIANSCAVGFNGALDYFNAPSTFVPSSGLACTGEVSFYDTQRFLGNLGPIHLGGSKNNFLYWEDGVFSIGNGGLQNSKVVGAVNNATRLVGTNGSIVANGGYFEARKTAGSGNTFELQIYVPATQGRRMDVGFSLQDIALFGATGSYDVDFRWGQLIQAPYSAVSPANDQAVGMPFTVRTNASFRVVSGITPGATLTTRNLLAPGFYDSELGGKKPADCNCLVVRIIMTNFNAYSAGAVVAGFKNIVASGW